MRARTWIGLHPRGLGRPRIDLRQKDVGIGLPRLGGPRHLEGTRPEVGLVEKGPPGKDVSGGIPHQPAAVGRPLDVAERPSAKRVRKSANGRARAGNGVANRLVGTHELVTRASTIPARVSVRALIVIVASRTIGKDRIAALAGLGVATAGDMALIDGGALFEGTIEAKPASAYAVGGAGCALATRAVGQRNIQTSVGGDVAAVRRARVVVVARRRTGRTVDGPYFRHRPCFRPCIPHRCCFRFRAAVRHRLQAAVHERPGRAGATTRAAKTTDRRQSEGGTWWKKSSAHRLLGIPLGREDARNWAPF